MRKVKKYVCIILQRVRDMQGDFAQQTLSRYPRGVVPSKKSTSVLCRKLALLIALCSVSI